MCASPKRGRGGPRGGKNGYRGRGGPGGPFRGPFRGSFRGPSRGTVRGRGAGRGAPRGTFRGRGIPGGVRGKPSRGSRNPLARKGSKNATPRYLTVLPKDLTRSIIITNLPPAQVEEAVELCNFVSPIFASIDTHDFSKFKMFLNKDSSGAVAVICVFREGRQNILKVVEKLHGKVFHGHHLIVQTYGNLQENDQLVTEYCVRITNLPTSATEEVLWKLFESCGKLAMIYLNRHLNPDGTLEALVNFEDSNSVINALKLNGSSVDNTNVKVVHLDWQLSIKISNLHSYVTHEFLENELKDYKPTFIRIISEKMKVAFVSFSVSLL